MIGVVIPAHDESAHIAAAVAAARCAAAHPALAGEPVEILVVADACRDDTAAQAAASGASTLVLAARNVGLARHAGAQQLLAAGARWLAFTDADSTVAEDWLAAQLALRCEAVCGCVWVTDWQAHGEHGASLAQAFAAQYRPVEGHSHIHGANLGLSAEAYLRAGGFPALATSEDVALVRALEAAGIVVAYSALPRVWTSARVDHRAPLGFGDALRRLSSALQMPLAGEGGVVLGEAVA
ncbi:glycosyltransferase family 2 protein [Pseudorhodoferax sp. Leaf274]|uniref:glycosyltransferase n=1 Tax=Pseudorhodoferax sp. Leaf274 TaxID=1736318 RepID=UPI0007037213|nr:glycosyltransferase [Pseudorhodoferax sp. Leaf274]KQP35463.1 glycosyl transferase [Pseudorhodoferax sp. Leaf274]